MSKLPTILQVIPTLATGGAERGCVDVGVTLAREGWGSLVASAGGMMVRELDRAGAKHITLPLATKNPFKIWRNAGRLAAIIRAEKVDIVHARSRAPAWSAYWAAKRCGVPFMTTFHAPYAIGNSAFKKFYNSVMARGEKIIAVSDYIRQHVIHTYGVSADRVRLIHRGIDMNIFNPDWVTPERMATLMRQWRLPDDRPMILLPGRLTRWKGQAVFLKALAAMQRRDFIAVLLGDDQGRTGYRKELEQLVETLGLSGLVLMPGGAQDMAAAYSLASVVVSASTQPEAFGRVIVEAGAMGRPVVVSDCGAVAETVVDGVTGFVVPPSDPDALAAALDKTLSLSAQQRQQMHDAARAHALENFTREKMCAATLDVYRDIAGLAMPDRDVA
jgi:glycosyltransferase involved in cell wall biosynthesis